MFYAQLDHEKICVGISCLSGEFNAENMILLESYDISILGKRYENGCWVEVETEPINPQTTEAEILMQNLSDLELQNIEIQQGQQLLAQQLTDLELTRTN